MENSFSSDIMNIFGHRFDGPDSIQYRVQWTDRRCEWVDGNFLDNQKYAKYVIKYWQVGPREFTDEITQTEDCFAFDFSITKDNISKWASNFHTFRPNNQNPQEPYSIIPCSIDSIDVSNNIALVHFFEDSEPAEMDLDRLLMLAPSLIANFYIDQ